MNCHLVDKHIYAYCENKLSPDFLPVFEAHLQECEECRTKVYLTKMENSLLREGYGIPELDNNFTKKVLESIQQKNTAGSSSVQILRRLSNRAETAPQPRSAYRYLVSAALAASLFLALMIPGFNSSGLVNNSIAISDATDDLTIKNYNKSMAVGNKSGTEETVNEKPGNSLQSLVKEESRIIAMADQPTVGSEDNAGQTRSGMRPQITAITTQRDNRDLDHMSFEAKNNEPMFFLQPSNLPVDYQLTEIISDIEDRLTFKYSNISTGQNLTISLSSPDINPDKENREISAAAEGQNRDLSKALSLMNDTESANSDVNNSFNWSMTYNEQPFIVTLTGDFSSQELNDMAKSMNFMEAINNDTSDEIE